MNPLVNTVGPLAGASATKISAVQKAAAAQALVINGAASDASANNICTSQTPSGAGNLTLNGTLVNATTGTANIYATYSTPRRVYITSAGNDSGRTFTVTGTVITVLGATGVTETVTGADTSTVSTTNVFSTVSSVAISGSAAAGVTVGVNGIATLDKARRVLITCGGDDTGITATITGTDYGGLTQTETITLVNNSTVYSQIDYLTVTGITTSGAVATTISVGTNGIASSPWFKFDPYAMGTVAMQFDVTGTVNYSLEETMDDPCNLANPVAMASMVWSASSDTAVVAATADKFTRMTVAPTYARILLNSGTGSVRGTAAQSLGPVAG